MPVGFLSFIEVNFSVSTEMFSNISETWLLSRYAENVKNLQLLNILENRTSEASLIGIRCISTGNKII